MSAVITLLIIAETHSTSPDQRVGGAAVGQSLWERGGERQEDEDGDGAGVPVPAQLHDHLSVSGHHAQPPSAQPNAIHQDWLQVGAAGQPVVSCTELCSSCGSASDISWQRAGHLPALSIWRRSGLRGPAGVSQWSEPGWRSRSEEDSDT